MNTNSEIGKVTVVASMHKSAFAIDCDALAPVPCTCDSRSYVSIYQQDPSKAAPVQVSVQPR